MNASVQLSSPASYRGQRLLKAALAGLSASVLFFMFFNDIKSGLSSGSDNSFFNNSPQKNSIPVIAAIDGGEEAEPLSVTSVVSKAQDFKALLSSSQQSTLQQTYTATLARKWSNLPCGSGCRNGISFGSLTSAQLAAALEVIQEALGSTSNNGYDEFEAIRVAEDYLTYNAGAQYNQYNSGLRWIAFLNEPSETGAWMLQFGGHHYAANIAFNNGHVIGATPLFVALEPTTFTYNNTSYAPMEDERDAFRTMLASLSSSEFNTAKLSTTFSDCLMSPGESNGNTNTFPTTKQGIKCSNLTTTQKNLVLAAIQNYVQDMDAGTAAAIMTKYTNEIDDTYIAFTGNATVGSAGTFLNANTNYVRIDGPTVWIEFACQNGVIIQNQIHYHSVWRDHNSDYGVDLTGSAIDEPLGLSNVSYNKNIRIYPNPAAETIYIETDNTLSNAKVTVVDASGRIVLNKTVSGTTAALNINVLPAGNYIIKVENSGRIYSSKFIKQ